MILNIIAQNWKKFSDNYLLDVQRIIEVAFYGGNAYLIDYLKQVISQNPKITVDEIKHLLNIADREARLFLTRSKT